MNKTVKTLMVAVVLAVLATVSVMATAYTNSVGGTTLPSVTQGASYRLENTIKMADVAYVNADTVRLIEIPAKTYVVAVGAVMSTVGANDVTFTVGDGSTTNQYITSYSMTNTAATASAYTAAKAYPAGGYIKVTFDGTAGSTGVLKVSAVVVDLQ